MALLRALLAPNEESPNATRAAHTLHGLRPLALVGALAGLEAEGAPHLEADLCEHDARQRHGELELVVAVAAPLRARVLLGNVPAQIRTYCILRGARVGNIRG